MEEKKARLSSETWRMFSALAAQDQGPVPLACQDEERHPLCCDYADDLSPPDRSD
jgi:hypothetical protein